MSYIERVGFHHALLLTIFVFITSILKSLVIPAILLALSTVIYSRIALFLLQITSVLNCVIHVLNRIIFVSNRNSFALTSHHFCFDYKMSVKAFLLPLFIKRLLDQFNLVLTEFCDSKML